MNPMLEKLYREAYPNDWGNILCNRIKNDVAEFNRVNKKLPKIDEKIAQWKEYLNDYDFIMENEKKELKVKFINLRNMFYIIDAHVDKDDDFDRIKEYLSYFKYVFELIEKPKSIGNDSNLQNAMNILNPEISFFVHRYSGLLKEEENKVSEIEPNVEKTTQDLISEDEADDVIKDGQETLTDEIDRGNNDKN